MAYYCPIDEQATTTLLSVQVCESVTELPVLGSTWPVLAMPKVAVATVEVPTTVTVDVYCPEELAAVIFIVPAKET